MSVQIFYTTQIENSAALLTGDEAGHCSRVLRKRVGDTIHLTDGVGHVYSAVISESGKKEVSLTDVELLITQVRPSGLHIAIAPTKNIARFEWFLEKATEIGIHTITPVLTARSERKVIKPERLQKILLAAMKQSKNYHLPTLAPLCRYSDMLATYADVPQKYIAHCMEPDRHLQALYNAGESGVILVGPEGDFSDAEVQEAIKAGWQEVSLGPSRLRTETAGIVATHIVSLLSQNIECKK